MSHECSASPTSRLIVLLLLSAPGLCLGAAAAEDDAIDENPYREYVEYRVQPELGQITVFTGWVRGEKSIGRMEANAKKLLKDGVLACTGKEPRVFRRTDKLAGRTIETLITVRPPPETSDAEEWVQQLVILIDGKKKVDCSLGTVTDDDLIVYGVQLFPEDGTLLVTASDSEGQGLALPENVERLDDPTTITNDAFELPTDEGNDAETPQPKAQQA